MKFLIVVFLLFAVFSTNAVFAPLPGNLPRDETPDWAALFPEFPGCERDVQPMTVNGDVFEQTAVYKRQKAENFNPPVYYGCGEVTLRFMPAARKSANANYAANPKSPFYSKGKVKTFDAYSVRPRCGNDFSRGTISVYFDEDKVLIVNAKRGVGDLFKFAETADYEMLKSSIDEYIKSPKSPKSQVPGRNSF